MPPDDWWISSLLPIFVCLTGAVLWVQAGDGTVSRQQPIQTAVGPSPQGSEQPAEGGKLVLRAGEEIVLRNKTSTSSAEGKVGDTIQFEVIKSVKVGELVVAKGAIATGKVTLAQAKGRRGRGGKLEISIEQVKLVTGESCKVHAKVALKAGDRSTGDDIVGTILTAPIPPLGAFLIPLVLWERGDDLVVTRRHPVSRRGG